MSGLAGRRPKPEHLRLVEGNASKRPPRKNRLARSSGTPEKTPLVAANTIASAQWDRLSKILGKELTPSDGPQLERTCLTYARWVRAEVSLEEKGMVYSSQKRSGGAMPRAHPLVEICAKFSKLYQDCIDRFGLNPVMREKVASIADEDREADPAEQFF